MRERFLDGFEHDGRARRRDARHRRNLAAQHLSQMLGVLGADLQQKAVLAGDVMDLEHFRDLRQRLRRRLLGAVLVGPDRDKRQQ